MNTESPKHRSRARGPARGFTLLEMLLSVLVFGLLATAAYGVLDSLSRAATEQEATAQRLKEVQLAVLRIERELRQTIATGMFSADPASSGLQGSFEALEFSFLVTASEVNGGQSRVVQYRHANASLYRLPGATPILDDRDIEHHALLRGVKRLVFSFLDDRGRWHARWPSDSGPGLPMAVRLDMDVDRLGRVQRLVELPGDRP